MWTINLNLSYIHYVIYNTVLKHMNNYIVRGGAPALKEEFRNVYFHEIFGLVHVTWPYVASCHHPWSDENRRKNWTEQSSKSYIKLSYLYCHLNGNVTTFNLEINGKNTFPVAYLYLTL